jgi:hypothetical protein
MLSTEQWKEIDEVLDESTDVANAALVEAIRMQLYALVDKEPLRLAVIQLLIQAENLGLEVDTLSNLVSNGSHGSQIVMATGTRFAEDSQTYSKIVFMSDDDDDDQGESE